MEGTDNHCMNWPCREMHLLMVEDNLPDALFLKEILSEAQDVFIQITHVTSFAEAEACLCGPGGVDLVLLDLGLPDAYRLEAIDRISRIDPRPPVVVMSGYPDHHLEGYLSRQIIQGQIGKSDLTLLGLLAVIRDAVGSVQMA